MLIIKPYIFWIKIILAIFLAKTRPDKTIFSALTNLTIDFDWSKELSKIQMQNPQCLLCLVLISFSFSLFLTLSGPSSKRWSAWTRWLCRSWTRLKNLSALTGFYFLLLDLQGEFWEIRTFPTQSFSLPCWLEDEPAVREVIWGQEVQTWFCKRNVTRCWLWRIFDVSCDEDSGEMKQGDNAMRWHLSICTRFVGQHIHPLFLNFSIS